MGVKSRGGKKTGGKKTGGKKTGGKKTGGKKSRYPKIVSNGNKVYQMALKGIK